MFFLFVFSDKYSVIPKKLVFRKFKILVCVKVCKAVCNNRGKQLYRFPHFVNSFTHGFDEIEIVHHGTFRKQFFLKTRFQNNQKWQLQKLSFLKNLISKKAQS